MSPLPAPAPLRFDRVRSPLLFDWRADDLSLTPRTGQLPTFARASVGSAVPDSLGRLRQPVHSLPAWASVDTDGDGVRDALGLLLDPADSNSCLQSENFGTTWTDLGTPTRIAAFDSLGSLVFDLLGDDDGATVESKQQTITLTGSNGPRGISLYLADNSDQLPAADGFGLEFQDTTVPASRLLVHGSFVAGVLTVANDGAGVNLIPEYIGLSRAGRRVYRATFQSDSCTIANGHRIILSPARTGSQQGNILVGGVHIGDLAVPTGYLKTTTAVAFKSRDALTYAINFLPPRDWTVYARLVRPAWADASSINLGRDPTVLSIGSAVPRLELFYASASRTINASVNDGVNSVSIGKALLASPIQEICLQVLGRGAGLALDVGAGFGSLAGPSSVVVNAWGTQTLTLGDIAWATTNGLGTPLLAVRIAAGARTMADLRI